MKILILAFIRFYQRFISRYTPRTCRFYPTCSQYGATVIGRFGAAKGTWLLIKRMAKCHPFHPGGIDMPPGEEDESSHTSCSHPH
ncbi:membrane protein insertion efficiency factor YidD [Alkalicoccobacillus plakortidis]|uniref:Putative membrane protein insertion efficiency factor n=1 Tax=Alkalicoccobacillus plakortidis TaxID=444060 RepID=A0ABT0XLD6_9BACI|nr:membrane protein insertion efficiency factor YidD [Alkalicoccobacillus plakortidis]MCM2676726.1 membrane protein insertion efficiency factor YidD [Alkalicoccobacillus plakortidis]